MDSLTSENIKDELLFERMKLISIRDLKIKRLQKALFTTVFWVVISLSYAEETVQLNLVN